MPDIPGDGKTRVDWVPAIANINAPTVSELNAGIRVSRWITADGIVGFRPETADVPTGNVESTFDTNTNGRRTFSGTMLRFKKQSGSDVVYTTMTPDVTGFITIRRSLPAANAFASAQPIQVFPVICGETAWMDPEPNTVERFEVPVKLTDQPALRAVVA
ncbi:phage tail tube protein [Micromonospora sp. NPDC003944]